MNAFPFLLMYLYPFLLILGWFIGSWALYLVPLYSFVVMPVVDYFVGQDAGNPDKAEQERRNRNQFFYIILWIWVPVEIGLLIFATRAYLLANWRWWEQLGWILSVGTINGGIGITIAHELGHRFDRWNRALSLALLVAVFYAHWRYEHVAGHHRLVATPEDPATARKGQSIYSFFIQTIAGTFRDAWLLAREHARQRGRKQAWINEMTIVLLVQALVVMAIAIAWGVVGVFFYLAQSVISFLLLEMVNYVEHYGLVRQRSGDTWEKVTARHSWNNSNILSNWLLINLQRHPDHHLFPARRYPLLRHLEESPQLPTGYAGMILIALIPPLWRRVVDPLIPDERE